MEITWWKSDHRHTIARPKLLQEAQLLGKDVAYKYALYFPPNHFASVTYPSAASTTPHFPPNKSFSTNPLQIGW